MRPSPPSRLRLVLALVMVKSAAPFMPGRQSPRVAAHARRPLLLRLAAEVAETEAEVEAEKEPSFLLEMRQTAMALHSKDQSREGKQKAQTPVAKWEPGRADYLQFLVDSRAVYACFEEIVGADYLAAFRDSGLERSAALTADIAWFGEQGVPEPPVAEQGATYTKLLREMAAAEEWPQLVCHFYNHYFAHTAGGRMIGKRMSDKLLDGRTLNFYKWEAGDVDKELLPALRAKIDAMAAGWTREEKDACLGVTAESFKYGGSLLQHISRPPST